MIIAQALRLADSAGGGRRALTYGGMAIGGTPVSRYLADSKVASRSGLVKRVLDAYEGEVEIWEVLPLKFITPSVLASRSDSRSGLFESLIVDAAGFINLNVAPPGIKLDLALSTRAETNLKIAKEADLDQSKWKLSFKQ